jgi:glycolate oxidase FAD binding subunit
VSAVPSVTPVRERPTSVASAGELLRELGEQGRAVRVRGGGTKLAWDPRGAAPEVELETAGLGRILEHNRGDFTAVLEAGVRLADAQAAFAEAGQMFALDPPLGAGEAATIGGVVASADSGPLRHRYGGVRDLILGVTVVLSDGTVAKAGGRVIKNVAGYDLGKLFAGSYGTLGLIATVSVRLHPRSTTTATARATSADPAALARAALTLTALPLEADSLDVGWAPGSGTLLVRFAGPTAEHRARSTAERLASLHLDEPAVVQDDDALWAGQRAAQRCPEGAVAKVAGVIGDLETVIRAAEAAGARLVARAGLGLAWASFPAGADMVARVESLRASLPSTTVTVLDGAAGVSDPWPAPDPGVLAVMERLKARFDPARVFRPGALGEGL